MSDWLDKLAATQRKPKAKASFSLDAENYAKFVEECKKRRLPQSRVIDALIERMLNE